jgi:hypothetical protein
MGIINSLFIQDASLQEYLVDKTTGEPLADGIVYFYEDTSRTTLKPVYVQTGSPGSYTYIQLPNPLILSSVGTTQYLGQDIKIFYYPYDVTSTSQNPPVQPYYVAVFNSQNVPQFVRENWPFLNASSIGNVVIPTLGNVVVNNEFWRNIGTIASINANTLTIAPSQHDGFRYPDITYETDFTGQTDSLTFTRFAAGSNVLTDDIQPEFYLNFTSNGVGSGTFKRIKIPLSLHLLTLGGVPNSTITLQGQSVSGGATITLEILRDTGSGASTPSDSTQIGPSVTFNTSWTKEISETFTFPAALPQGDLGAGGDDAFYLLITLPNNATSINIAKPSLYLSATVPTNNFQTYDVIDSVINSPRTGDTRTSLNSFNPYGWVLCNDGVISDASGTITPPTGIAVARANQDTWQLYSLLWSNTLTRIYDNTGAFTTKGATAIADFAAFKQLLLPLTLGRALLGLPPASTFTYDHTTSLLTITNASLVPLFYMGSIVSLSSTGTLSDAFTANTIYYAIPNNSTTIKLASSYANALTGTALAAGTTNGTGTQTINFVLGANDPSIATTSGGFGQARHTQLEIELATHSHPGSTVAGVNGTATAPPFNSALGTSTAEQQPIALVIQPDGSSTPFNIVQPSSYLNLFFKL